MAARRHVRRQGNRLRPGPQNRLPIHARICHQNVTKIPTPISNPWASRSQKHQDVTFHRPIPVPHKPYSSTTDKLNPTLITELQAIIGTLLYYAKAVDPTLLNIANELASQQAQPTQRVLKAANRVLSYCSANHHNALIYHACDMALHAFADASSYLCRPHARSVAGAIYFLGNKNDPTRINGSIHVFSTIIPCVVASAGKTEYAALFATGQHAASLRTTLADMGYPQNPTIIMCDNTSAIGIATDISIKQKRSKAVDMRFHWIRDCVRQAQFIIAYIPTQQHLANYFTKHLPKESRVKFHSFLVHNMAADCNSIIRT
jgi:hypothetical protein